MGDLSEIKDALFFGALLLLMIPLYIFSVILEAVCKMVMRGRRGSSVVEAVAGAWRRLKDRLGRSGGEGR